MSEEDVTPSKRTKRSSSLGLNSPASSGGPSGGPSSPSSGGLVITEPPCAACKSLRRKCTRECVFLPYFPRDDPDKFSRVHKVFGASNVSKMLQELPVNQREDAVASLEFEAQARVQDPVYGCVGILCLLQKQVATLKEQLSQAQGLGQVQTSDPNQSQPPTPNHSQALNQVQFQTPVKGSNLNSGSGFGMVQTNTVSPKSQLAFMLEKSSMDKQASVSHAMNLSISIPKKAMAVDSSMADTFFSNYTAMDSSNTKPNSNGNNKPMSKFGNEDGSLHPNDFLCFSPELNLQSGSVGGSPYTRSTFERIQNSINSFQVMENS